jgi:N-glycosylase/DNA lyase
MLLALSTKFGKPIFFNERTYNAFPAPEALAEASLKDLAKCELGYRAKYVSQTARAVCTNDFDFASLRRLHYEEAKKVLLEFPGVGQKVADCVLLFSLGKREAFPVDVWIRRVLLRHYAQHFSEEFVQRISQEESLNESQYKRLNLFGREYFGKYAGYAQEYLYHYERTCCGSKPRKPVNRKAD